MVGQVYKSRRGIDWMNGSGGDEDGWLWERSRWGFGEKCGGGGRDKCLEVRVWLV